MRGHYIPPAALAALVILAPEYANCFSSRPPDQASFGHHTSTFSLQKIGTYHSSPRKTSRLHVKIIPSLQRTSSSTPLRNIPLEDALDIELLEMEAELDLAKPRDAQEPHEQPQQITRTNAASIIAGTAIGGGFLALPSVTSPLGYGPAALGLILAWTFLLLSSTAFIEAAGLVADVRDMESGNGVGVGPDVAVAEEGAISVATVIRYAFGKKAALVGGTLFIAQMVAVVTAQVVKGAELFSDRFGIPYLVGCLVPTTLAGLFAFGSKPEVVDRTNTALTLMMVGGFAALIIGTIATGNVGKSLHLGALFSRADYGQLLPRSGGAWALPVFINMLCFGQSMPLVVERMTHGSKVNIVNGEDEARASSLFRARSATLLGAAVPLALTITWAAISTALVSPSISNPLAFLLSRGPAISIPVGLLATGAIGTTVSSKETLTERHI